MTSNPLLEKARRSLQVAEELLDSGNPDFAASRVYYAYLYTAQALLATKGLGFSRHGQVIAQYGFHFSKTRILDPVFHKSIDTAFQLRQLGDYQVEVPIQPETIVHLTEVCRRFIDAAAKYIEGLSESSAE